MTYSESKSAIEKLRNKDEILFRMAISHLVDVGIRFLTAENVEYTCEEINKRDDSHGVMTNGYECKIVKTASELAKIDHIHLLVYISNNVFYDVGQTEITRDRGLDIAQGLMDWIVSDSSDSSEDYDTFSNYCNINDSELKELGFEYLIPENNKEEI